MLIIMLKVVAKQHKHHAIIGSDNIYSQQPYIYHRSQDKLVNIYVITKGGIFHARKR